MWDTIQSPSVLTKYFQLANDQSFDQETFAGHEWLLMDEEDDMLLDYVASDVCVQASRAEGLGFSVLESLACGTPVVVSRVGGLVETVCDGSTGWTVPPGDARALAAALREVLERPDEARRRAAAGAAIVRERFSSDTAFARLADVLAEPLPR